jgi:hypothetical protein
MGPPSKLKSGDEVEAVTRRRRFFQQRPGQRRRAKRKLARRAN